VLHRPALIDEAGLRTLHMLMASGYLVVTEFDDHPDHFSMMQRGGELTFTGVHALQTSTPALAEVLRRYNPEVAVFPNAIPVLPDVTNFAHGDALTLFFGALNRERDWQQLMPVINEVAAMAGDRLRFQVVHDHGFFNALQSQHKYFTPTCDYDSYLRILGSCEICFMPLADTPFNRAKSDLKFIESASLRVTALASPIVYEHSIQDGVTGLLFRDPEALRVALLRLLALPELARQTAEAARAYVIEQRMLAYQVAPRMEWYRSLWDRRQELHEALAARMAARTLTPA
jgi:glycosyltransferase involved in cell wall biosynthesis